MRNIETNRFILRKVDVKDELNIFNILSDKDVIEYLNMDMHNSIEDTRKLLNEYENGYEDGTKYPFAIIEKETNRLLGVFLIKLDIYDDNCFEFTIYLNKDDWGKGIYTEILPYMVEFAFEDIKTENFRGFVMEKNKASISVLKKYGFKLEKIFEVPGIEGKILSFLKTREE